MRLEAAQQLAYQLMQKHGIISWNFRFDNAVRCFGTCCYRKREITLSRRLTELNDESQVMDTILHEIAHALTPNDGHGWRWKQKCIEIGARPERCYKSSNVNAVPLRYVATCGGCGKEYQKVKKVDENIRRACKCQNHLPWDRKILLKYLDTSLVRK